MNKIPQNRALIYIVILGLLPLMAIVGHLFVKERTITDQRQTIQTLEESILLKQKKQAQNQSVMKHFKDADHFYIDKHLETITLLEPEIQKLQEVVSNKNYAGDETIKKRLDFLTSPNNRLSFTEGSVQSTPFFQETTETLIHPVETNAEDLKKILARIEGVKLGSHEAGPKRPQLVILDFKIDKKKISDKNEVYLLNLKLLKREYL